MTDFATLALKIDSSEVGSGVRELDRLTQAGGRAEQSVQRVTASAGAQRAGMQQLSYQLSDVATGLSMIPSAANPAAMAMTVFAQQGSQVVQALALMKGEATGLVGFLAGPWGAVVMGAVTVTGMLATKLIGAKEAADDLKLSTFALKDAQNSLGGVFDLTTGKMNNQTDAAVALAKAQIILAQATSQKNLAEARGQISSAQDARFSFGGGIGGGFSISRSAGPEAIVAQRFALGYQNASQSIDALKALQAAGKITADTVASLARSFSNAAVETKNLADLDKAYSSILDGKVDPSLRKVAESHDRHRKAMRDSKDDAESFTDVMEKLTDAFQHYIQIAKLTPTPKFDEAGDMARMMESVRRDLSAQDSPFLTGAEQTAQWNAQLRDLSVTLGQISGGSGLAALAQFLSGGKGVGGQTGALVNYLAGIQYSTFDKDGRLIHTLGGTFSEALDKVFGGQGSFTKLMQGAGVGMMFGTSVFGNSTGTQVGSALGGAIGQGLSSTVGGAVGKALGSVAGSIAGAVVPVIGGLIGGLLGGLFKTTPKGSGTVTQDSISVTANKNEIKDGLNSFGLSLQSSVSKIASSLGGKVGKYDVAIGNYDGKYYQVGSQNDQFIGKADYWKKSSNVLYDGQDANAALRAAIAGAIADGAIEGVRAGTQALLKGGKDIDAQLQKAVSFEGVFKTLKQSTDPIGAALDDVAKKFSDLTDIFKEAGATTEEYAQLEKLRQIQMSDALDQARKTAVDKLGDPLNLQIKLIELMGKSEASLAATRALEVTGMKASLQPLQAMVYTLEDAQSVIAKFTPLRDDLKAFRETIFGASGGAGDLGATSAKFRGIALAAANGDATALAGLRGAAQDYLEAAKANASSLADYNRARAEVLAATDKGIFAANEMIDYQQAQIDAVAANGALLADIKANLTALAQQAASNSTDMMRLWKRLEENGFINPIQVQVVS